MMADTDEAICSVVDADDNNSMACKVRRKIEEYLERRRYKDELGDPNDKLALEGELE